MSRQSASDLSPSARAFSLGAVIVHMVGIGLTLGLTYPLTSLVLESWQTPAWLIGVAGAMPALSILLLMPLFPKLIRRFGTVASMCLGCVVGCAALVAMPLFQTVEAWIVLRFLMGAGLALPWLVGETWINTVALDSWRGRVVSLYTAALFIGFALGPLLLDSIGIDGWPPIGLAIGALGLAMVPLVLAARVAPAIEPHPSASISDAVRRVPIVAVAALAAGFAVTMSVTFLPLVGGHAGLDQAEALRLLSAFLIGGLVLQAPVGWAADRLPRLGLLTGLSFALAAVAVAMAGAPEQPLPMMLLAFISGGLVLGIYSLGLTVLGERYPAGELAVANAAFLMAHEAGAVVGPIATGAAMGASASFGFTAVMTGVGLVLGLVALAVWRAEAPQPTTNA